MVQGARAGFVSRMLANVIDFIGLFVALVIEYLCVAAAVFLWNPRSFSFPAPSLIVAIVVGSVTSWIYFAVCWMTTGRTYGDFVLGLRVIDRKGRRVHAARASARAAACVVAPIGIVWVGIDRRSRSVQDILCGTVVIYDWPHGAL